MRPTLLSLFFAGSFLCAAANLAHAQPTHNTPQTPPGCLAPMPQPTPTMLSSRKLPDGVSTEFYGRYEMAFPIQNFKCQFRQLLFTTQNLTGDYPAYSGSGPQITIIIRRGFFRRRVKDMRVYQVYTNVIPNPQKPGPNQPTVTEYVINAEAQAPVKARYYADISIIGFPMAPGVPDTCQCPPQCPNCCGTTTKTPQKP